jgi:hypothetical protein
MKLIIIAIVVLLTGGIMYFLIKELIDTYKDKPNKDPKQNDRLL